jgi:hypothetical protein
VLDKRRHPRFACDLVAEIHVGGGKMPARGVDISRGGMCLSVERAIPVRAEVQLKLTLLFGSNTFSEPLLLPARIMWCTQLPDELQVGCMFKTLSTEQVQYLDMFLRFLRGEVLADGDPNAVAEDDDEDDKDPDAEPFG